MPDRAIAPLEELVRIVGALHMIAATSNEEDGPAISSFADKIHSLLPTLANRFEALEAEIAALRTDRLVCCARCNEMKECLSIATGFAGEHEPLCADCISTERLEADDANS